ncbi:hypothetical protein A11A3_15242 [Alcanivorax hongdengensis A-11-3]|uniref:SbsA Ig-like domain-containing protein n=1 Tax=Alcanivorax hongdengensis A-11-3 TaxID=1177179 RepID=L0WBK6_9GAMM|nr:Ig-like domain-containing protein [Alcanivorax hongdengensis]EKF73120.1 hypothetical protein A11A3_15242 [Alcanivorax hongdengensis A-11-3]
MTLRHVLVALTAAALAACGGSEQDVSFDWQRADVYYSYPYDGQVAVSPRTPIVVRFSMPISVDASNFTLYQCASGAERCDSSDSVDTVALADPQSVDGGKSIVLNTDAGLLKTGTTYSLVLNDIDTDKGSPSFPNGSLSFRTRLADGGALDQQVLAQDLAVEAVTPDGSTLPFVDFSTIQVRFNQNLKADSLTYGDTDNGASVELESANGETVPATLLVQGSAVVIDPKADLQPGTGYTLKMTGAVRGINDDALSGGYQQQWVARDTTPRATLVQQAAPADSCTEPSAGSTSKLTGQAVNCVPVIAKLLGDTTVSRQSGDVYAQLAFAPHYPDVTPLRIPKGSLLKGDPLAVLVGGHVDAGFDSGEVTVSFLSDATGYLLPNPYSDDPNAPKQLHLTIDVAFDTKDPRANGAFNQNLLQVELVGTAITDTEKGSLVVDAIGVVEPKVLGAETAYGVLSFHMESYPDQQSAPMQPEDQTSPSLAAWMPGEQSDKMRPGDPVILNFSEPLANDTVVPGDTLRLTDGGVDVPFDWYMDGVSVVIKPQSPLAYGTDYQVQFTDGITDLAGNPAMPQTLNFAMPDYAGNHEAIVTTAYPGFPCAFDKSSWDIGNGDHGICRGGESDDDHLPVMPMPANRSIRVQFSQVMEPGSIKLGTSCDSGSFRVEKLADADQDGKPDYITEDGKKKYTCGDAVAGKLEYRGRTLVFTPKHPWDSNNGWYRYVLMSENNDFDAADCRSGAALCAVGDKALQTAVLEAPEGGQGGPNMEIYFQGAPASQQVFQQLRNLPAYDVNADFVHQASEPQAPADPDNAGGYLVAPNAAKLQVQDTGGLLLGARVGCSTSGGDCPGNKFIYVTGALDTQILGYDADEDAVQVNIYPTLLETTSVDVYANILLLGEQTIPTGPQVMRVRYQKDGSGNRTQPVTGWIRNGDDGPIFETTLDLYLSAPYLEPKALGLTLNHDLYSYPLTLKLSGPVTFLDDGRLQIGLVNVEAPDSIKVNLSLIGIGAANMTLAIPNGGVNLNYVSTPVKH